MATAKKNNSAYTAAPATDKEKALATAIAQIERAFGKGSIMRMSDRPTVQVDAVPTGSLSLDLALGIGGLPRGRIIEIYGPESSGKTTLALHVVARGPEAGRRGGLHRRGACPGPHLRPGAGGGHRLHAHLPAGHRRAGAGDHRGSWCAPAPVDRGGGGLGGRPGAPGGDRGRDGRQLCGPPGATDEPGTAEAGRLHRQDPLHRHLHQPAPRKDWRGLRQPRGDHRRSCAEVLRLRAHRHPQGTRP